MRERCRGRMRRVMEREESRVMEREEEDSEGEGGGGE